MKTFIIVIALEYLDNFHPLLVQAQSRRWLLSVTKPSADELPLRSCLRCFYVMVYEM